MTHAHVFSGVQPTGSLHLGNYLGAILRFIALQKQYACLYCIVDLHAITLWQDPEALRNATRETAAAFLASGLSGDESLIFNQARVGAHAELAWIFNCVARMGWLSRMTQFKEKSGKNRENASVGLFTYPTLMAADVLLYKARIVPVGEDQKQHIELARDVAQKFNGDFAESIARLSLPQAYFPLPEPLISENIPRVMSLRDGTKKMSKSDASDYSRINLNDSPDLIAQKIRKSKTDSLPFPTSITECEGRPEAYNLAKVHCALSGEKIDRVLDAFGGKSFSIFKSALTDILVEKLSPIATEMERLRKAPEFIDDLLEKSAEKARVIADKTLAEVKNIVGLLN